MLAGLQWVNDNIEAFGGDPKRVTIAGQSAGSIAIGMLSVSPLAHGLYDKQIMESGSPAFLGVDGSVALNSLLSQTIAEKVGCADKINTIQANPESVVNCLRKVDAMELSKAEASILPHSSFTFLPQYGDELVPKNPRLSIIEGDFQCNNVLIGDVRDEGSFQITTMHPEIFGFFGEKNPRISKTLGKTLLLEVFATFPPAASAIEYYLPPTVMETDYETVRYQVYTAAGDFVLLCPTVYYAEKFAEKCNNSYFYFWTHRPSTTPWAPWMGTTHFTEVQFVFGVPVRKPSEYRADEVPLSRDMIQIWSTFVKTGQPNTSWPRYSNEKPTYVQLDSGRKMTGRGPHRKNCDFFRPFFGFVEKPSLKT